SSRPDGATVDVNRRHVRASHGDHAAWHVLVAPADGHHAIHPLALNTGFDAVGDDLAGNQRVLHTLGAHRHTVGNGRGAEYLWVTARLAHSRDRCVGKTLQPGVARSNSRMAIGDADHRLVEVGFVVAHRVVHGAVGRTC